MDTPPKGATSLAVVGKIDKSHHLPGPRLSGMDWKSVYYRHANV